MPHRQLAELARKHGFGDHAEQLERLARWGMRIEASDSPTEHQSCFGGRPDLGPADDWPTAEASSALAGRPLTFMAQIRLDDVTVAWDGPSQGLLSFFLLIDDDGLPAWEPGAARVLFVSLPEAEPRPGPSVTDAEGMDPVPWRLTPELCLPWPGVGTSPDLDRIGLHLDDLAATDRYMELCHALAEHQGLPTPSQNGPAIWEADRFAGFAAALQGEPTEDCAALAASPDAGSWRHLLQLVDFESGEATASYFCASTDARGAIDLARVQAVHHHS